MTLHRGQRFKPAWGAGAEHEEQYWSKVEFERTATWGFTEMIADPEETNSTIDVEMANFTGRVPELRDVFA